MAAGHLLLFSVRMLCTYHLCVPELVAATHHTQHSTHGKGAPVPSGQARVGPLREPRSSGAIGYCSEAKGS